MDLQVKQMPFRFNRARLMGVATLMVVSAGGLMLSGCSNKEAKASKGDTQVAAKVNSEEISVHQINYVLQRTPGIGADNAEAASRQVLERLIGQELAIQQAKELKLDRNPATVQALEAARRDVLARAYTEQLGNGVSKPTPEEVADFYRTRPNLFKDRKLYALLEVNVLADSGQIAAVQQQARTRAPKDFLAWLKSSGLKHQSSQTNQPAENIPLELLDRVAAMSDGQSAIVPQPGGAKVVYVMQTARAPVDEATAKPAIEQFILNDRKRQKVDADMKALRAKSKVELVGRFAQASGGAPTVATPAAVPAPPSAGDSVSKGLGLK
jgi:EpsD family peptidyl-prolyl cis-trans isomerase